MKVNADLRIRRLGEETILKTDPANNLFSALGSAGILRYAIGTGAAAGADNAISYGVNANAQLASSIAFGNGATAGGANSIAIGIGADAQDGNIIVIGNSAYAEVVDAIAIGRSSGVYADDGVSIGRSSAVNGQDGIALGRSSAGNGTNSIAIGQTAAVAAPNSIAIGTGITVAVANERAVAVGFNASASAVGAIAIGDAASATDGIAIGDGAGVTVVGMAIGQGASSANDSSHAIGNGTTATGEGALAVGQGAATNGADAIAVGPGASSTGSRAITLGQGTTVGFIDGISLGALGTIGAANAVLINSTGVAVTNATANAFQINSTDTTPDAIFSATRAHHRHLAGTGNRNVVANAAGDLIIDTGQAALFADNATTAPVTAGSPTTTEIETFNNAQGTPVSEGIVYYTGTDTAGDPVTHVYWIDGNGDAYLIEEPAGKDLIVDWAASTAYVTNEEVTAVSPTTGHRTVYRRTAAGTSGATFDAAEEANWTAVGALGINKQFADNITVAPATAGEPTIAEIEAFANASNFFDGLYYYTGTDTSTDVPTHVYWVDQSGNAVLLKEPADKDTISDWAATTAYVINQEVTAVSPTTGHRTLYRRTAAGTSGATFDAAEEANWTTISTVGSDRVHADNATMAPATAGEPTITEAETFATGANFRDGLLYYTGTDTSTDAPTYVYWIDASGNATLIEKAAVTKYAADLVMVADTVQTVTHNLNTTDILIQAWDAAGELFIPDVVDNKTANTVDIQISTSETIRIVII